MGEWAQEKFRLGKHENSHMQRRYAAHPDGWSVELIESVDGNLLDVEQKYLDEHFGNPFCMNQNPIAKAPPSRKGVKKTPQQIELHRLAITGKKHSQETKDKMSATRKGRVFTPEWRKNMSLAMKGAKKRAALRRQELCPSVAQNTSFFVSE